MPREIDISLEARLDVLKREIVILSSRLTKVINDSAHLVRALRALTGYDTLSGNKGEVGSETVRQTSLDFGSVDVEDYD